MNIYSIDEMFWSGQPHEYLNRPEYNLQFKKQVQELTITCVYDYNTIYRVCSILGIKKAKELIDARFDAAIQYVFERFSDFPDKMTADEDEAARATLKHVDPGLPELFESLLELSEYNSETLYRVFMSHGDGAKEIVEYASQLLTTKVASMDIN